MNRPRSAEGRNRDDLGIAALFRNVRLGGGSHGFIDKVVNSPDGLDKGNAQRLGDLFHHPSSCRLFVELHFAAEKVILIEVSEQKIRIGHAGVLAASGIADRARIRT